MWTGDNHEWFECLVEWMQLLKLLQAPIDGLIRHQPIVIDITNTWTERYFKECAETWTESYLKECEWYLQCAYLMSTAINWRIAEHSVQCLPCRVWLFAYNHRRSLLILHTRSYEFFIHGKLLHFELGEPESGWVWTREGGRLKKYCNRSWRTNIPAHSTHSDCKDQCVWHYTSSFDLFVNGLAGMDAWREQKHKGFLQDSWLLMVGFSKHSIPFKAFQEKRMCFTE